MLQPHCKPNILGYRGFMLLAMAVAAMAACVAGPITHLVSAEVIEGPVSTLRMWTMVAVMRIEAVVHVAVEVVLPVEPGAGSDKHAAVEPLRPVITVGGAVVGRE